MSGSQPISLAPAPLYLACPGGSGDHASIIAAAMTACAYSRDLVLGPGLWNILSIGSTPGVTGNGYIPNGTTLRGTRGKTQFNLSLPQTGDHARAAFTRDEFSHPIASGTTTVASPGAPEGSITIPCAAIPSAWVVNGSIGITEGTNQAQTYIIKAIDTGAKTVTLDRATCRAWSTSATVFLWANGTTILHPQDIHISDIDFVGGTCERTISIVSGRRCSGRRLSFYGVGSSDYCNSFDTGSYDCEWEDIYAEVVGIAILATEAGEFLRTRRLVVAGASGMSGNPLVIIQASYGHEFDGADLSGAPSGSGIQVGLDPVGSRGGVLRHIKARDLHNGIIVTGGSADIDIHDPDISGCDTNGIAISPGGVGGGGTPGRVRVFGGTLKANARHLLADTAVGVHVFGTHTEQATGTTAIEVVNGGKLALHGVDMQEDTATNAVYSSSGGELSIDSRCDIRSAKSAGCNLVRADAGVLHARDAKLTNVSGFGTAVRATGATTDLHAVTSVGCAVGVYANGCVVTADTFCDFTSATTPYSDNSGGVHIIERELVAADFPNALTWLDASGRLSSDGSAWGDQSVRGNGATQVTSGKRPTYTANGIGGLPSLVFDGATSSMLLTGMTAVAGDFILLVVCNPTSATGDKLLIDIQTGRLFAGSSLTGQSNTTGYYDGAYHGPGVSSGTGAQVLAFDWRAATGGAVYKNNLLVAMGPTGSYTQRAIGGGIAIGAQFDQSAAWFAGQIARFVLLANPTDADRVRLTRASGRRYGIAVA